MRRLTNILAIAGSCCVLLLSGCGLDQPQQDITQDPQHDAKDADTPSQPVAGDQAPVINVPNPPSPAAPGPANTPAGPRGPGGGGGGSQGSEKRADTGNPDNDPRATPEIICDDKEDNDGDLLIDCADPDCSGKTCSDMNGCTINDVCVEGVCTGTVRDCEAIVGNECSTDRCVPVGMLNDEFQCVSIFEEGTCTPPGNCQVALNPDGSCPDVIDACIVGTCIVVTDDATDTQTFECEAGNLANLTPEEFPGGCQDDNTCTADMCKDGVCMYSSLSGIPCDDGESCTNMDMCAAGECMGMNVPNICETDADCQKGFTCTSSPGVCSLIGVFGPMIVGEDCFSDEDCDGEETCEGEVLGGCTCDDENPCTIDDICDDGECDGTVPTTPLTCTDGNPCTTDVCVGEDCVSTPFSGECDDGIACTLTDLCTNGVCAGAPDPSACPVENVCQECICTVGSDIPSGCECTLLTGPSDDECNITLTNLALSAELIMDLTALNIPLSCEIGVTACSEGVVGACELSALFADMCSGATLNTACNATVFTLEANAELVATLCAELEALAGL